MVRHIVDSTHLSICSTSPAIYSKKKIKGGGSRAEFARVLLLVLPCVQIAQSLYFFILLWYLPCHTYRTPASTYTSDLTEFMQNALSGIDNLAALLVMHAPFADWSAGLLVTRDVAVPHSSLCRYNTPPPLGGAYVMFFGGCEFSYCL